MPTNIPDASGNGAGMVLGDPNTSTEVNVNIAKDSTSGPTAVAGNAAHDASDTGNPVKIGGYASNAAPTGVQDGDRVNAWFNRSGAQIVTLAGNSGSQIVDGLANTDGVNVASRGLYSLAIGYIYNGTTLDRIRKPNACARLISSAATTNATSVKSGAGNVIKIVGNNTVGNKRYLKLYDKASAPTVGTDTPVITLVIPASAPFTFDLTDHGFYFATGIAYAITGAAADADTTVIGAGDIECLNILYTN